MDNIGSGRYKGIVSRNNGITIFTYNYVINKERFDSNAQ